MATGRLPDPNTAPVTAKGDLYTYSTVPAKLAVGSNGDTLLADSAASQGLRWNPSSEAGKNKIINGDFSIWQRGTTFNSVASSAYTADRWIMGTVGDTVNVTRQAFTPADITAIGFGDAQYFFRMEVVSSNGSARTEQKIENVRTLANQNVTVSFWAKASTSTNLDVLFYQNFGSGGSSQVNLTAEVIALTTSWVRYSKTFAIPSVSGKTIGDGSHLALVLRETSASTNVTFDFFGVQVEAGSVATAFQTATGTLAGEFALACRYFFRANTDAADEPVGSGLCIANNKARIVQFLPSPMRTTPTISANNAGNYYVFDGSVYNTLSSLVLWAATANVLQYEATTTLTTLTLGRGALLAVQSPFGSIDISAEL